MKVIRHYPDGEAIDVEALLDPCEVAACSLDAGSSTLLEILLRCGVFYYVEDKDGHVRLLIERAMSARSDPRP